MGVSIQLRSDFSAIDLRRLARRSGDPNQTRRLLSLSEIYDGGSRGSAARVGGVGLQIIRDWVLRFNAEGPDGLIDKKPPGAPALLNDPHRKALIEIIESGPLPAIHGVVRWRLADLAQWIWEEFRISVSRQTLGRELGALGYVKLSARPRHHAQDPAAAGAFKKTFPTEWRKSVPRSRQAQPWRFGFRTKPGSARRTRSPGAGRNGERAPRPPMTSAPVRSISSAPSAPREASAQPWSCHNATPPP